MQFIQTIEFRTARYDEVNALMEEWVTTTQSTHTPTVAYTTRDRDADGNSYVQIVVFPSYDAAMRNSELPETSAFAEKVMKLCDGPPVFRNLDVLREEKL
jgi:quinol monooxygenase YgiN